LKRFIALSEKTIQLPKTTATQFKPSSRGSEAIQGAGQVLDRFAASAFAFALGPKLTSHDETRKKDSERQ
jgi:hypothetical protein